MVSFNAKRVAIFCEQLKAADAERLSLLRRSLQSAHSPSNERYAFMPSFG